MEADETLNFIIAERVYKSGKKRGKNV